MACDTPSRRTCLRAPRVRAATAIETLSVRSITPTPIAGGGPWRHLEAVEFATLEWVDWFNRRRLLEGISYVPPAELEDTYYQQCKESTLVA